MEDVDMFVVVVKLEDQPEVFLENNNDNLFETDDNQERHTLAIGLTVCRDQERDCEQNTWTRRHEEVAGEEGNVDKGQNEG
ncbi:hypothetical protein A2U01_0056370, partial [Trifolium medium]|nr:hypothetical protein [Trifolium medium]